MTIIEELKERYGHYSTEDLWLMLASAQKYSDSVCLKVIKVPDDEQQKMAAVDRVFREYIDKHPYFDIFYSKKFGAVYANKEGGFQQFATADKLAERIFDEMFNDVRELKLGGDHMTPAMRPAEEEELRKRLFPLIERMDDKDHYHALYAEYVEYEMSR